MSKNLRFVQWNEYRRRQREIFCLRLALLLLLLLTLMPLLSIYFHNTHEPTNALTILRYVCLDVCLRLLPVVAISSEHLNSRQRAALHGAKSSGERRRRRRQMSEIELLQIAILPAPLPLSSARLSGLSRRKLMMMLILLYMPIYLCLPFFAVNSLADHKSST